MFNLYYSINFYQNLYTEIEATDQVWDIINFTIKTELKIQIK